MTKQEIMDNVKKYIKLYVAQCEQDKVKIEANSDKRFGDPKIKVLTTEDY
jgi:hypothetical protein